jgi:hypothetical protein
MYTAIIIKTIGTIFKKHHQIVTRSKSKRKSFDALLERAFHMKLNMSKGMPFGA